MARKQKVKANVEQHEHITIEVTKFDVSIDAGRNYQLSNLDRCDRETKIFRHDSKLEITGNCIYPNSLIGNTHLITIFGKGLYEDQYEATLYDCQARDGFERVYKTVKGEEVPVYKLPDGIGYIEKHRGTKHWKGAAWTHAQTVNDMLSILPHIKPLYLEVHRVKKERSYSIRSVSLTTENPV